MTGAGALCGEAMREVHRAPDGEARWCFRCRAVCAFQFVVTAPVGVSYYGPSLSVECSVCGTRDGDLFPGRIREWEG